MEQGGREAKIRAQARKMNMPLPDAIANKPIPTAGLELYWAAFLDLTSTREVGMGEGPIPWTAMNEWCIRHGIAGDGFDRFVTIIRALDGEYLAFRARKNDKKGKLNPSKPPPPVRPTIRSK